MAGIVLKGSVNIFSYEYGSVFKNNFWSLLIRKNDINVKLGKGRADWIFLKLLILLATTKK